MRRRLSPEEARLWAGVVATVRPAHGRVAPEAHAEGPSAPQVRKSAGSGRPGPAAISPPKPHPKPSSAPDVIEPGRRRRIAREREPISLRLDLHGLGQDQARDLLHGFIARAHAQGARAVLIITGKGTRGDGVLRRRAPEWLAEPPSRARVAGVSQAERRHGGEGALYVALKRPV